MLKRIGILTLWLVGMIFPVNWLRRVSPTFRRHYDPLVPLEWVHVVMHMLLFAVLVILLIYVFQLPLNGEERSSSLKKTRRVFPWRTALIVLGTILVVGIFQEILQLQVKGRAFWWYEVYDLAVDLAGGMFGLGIAGLIWGRDEERVTTKLQGS